MRYFSFLEKNVLNCCDGGLNGSSSAFTWFRHQIVMLDGCHIFVANPADS
jgi:hypothetical protein